MTETEWLTATVALLDDHAGIAARDTMSRIVHFRYVFASEGLRDSNAYQAASERNAERKRLVGFLRDIFGNPFRPATLNLAWLTSTVLALANGIYYEKAFDRMPILADALQDAGCDNEEILQHCRSEYVHCRGCFVLDLLLGKE